VGLLVITAAAVIVVALVRQSRSPITAPHLTTPIPAGSRQPAPDFEIMMYQGQDEVGGQKLRLSQVLSKRKPVVLNFFAGLCPPCRVELPDLQKRYEAGGKDRYIMLAVDIGPYTGLGTRDDGKAVLQALGITFPAGTVFDEDILTAYKIFGMPSTFFITPDGMIIRKQIGLLTPDQIDAYIAELLRLHTTKP
jgi:thiol-disulfide isomerase/thioredoxin